MGNSDRLSSVSLLHMKTLEDKGNLYIKNNCCICTCVSTTCADGSAQQ